jgi:low temperature requirement protein LtrA
MTVPSFHDIPEHEYEVTPLELFFDLVFVFAVSQLTDHLLAYLSWRGVAETVVMLSAIFGAWFTTSWSVTILRADQSRSRWVVLAVMLLGLFMNASVTRAFTTSGWAFAIPLLLIQAGRAVWTLLNATDAVFREHYVRVLLWLAATSPLWIAGAAVGPEGRLPWWALAAGLDLLGRWLAHPIPGRRLRSENVPFDANHMLERCRLFLLIALGETVLRTGIAIAAAPMTTMTLVTGTAALAGTVALWALNFGRARRLTRYYRQEMRDSIRIGRYAVNALMLMVAGLIAVAAANGMVIAHPQGEASAALSLLLYGGSILYLVTQGWYLWVAPRNSPRLRLAGSAGLVLLGLAALNAPPYINLILVGASLAALARLDEQTSQKESVNDNLDKRGA